MADVSIYGKLTTVRFTSLFIKTEGHELLSDKEIICYVAERKDRMSRTEERERGRGER